ncbi:MAG: hypothetical protein ACRC7R_07730, partial [Sarcina sp.]
MKLIETIGEDGNNTISEYFIDSKITETILELNIKIIKTTEFIEKKIEEIFCEIVYDFEKDKILNGNNIHEK